MQTRFAGSQRVGERRRRRLAAGGDDHVDSPNADNPGFAGELHAPAGTSRSVDSAHIDAIPTEPSTTLQFPAARLIPAQAWKYVAGGLLTAGMGTAIMIAGWFAPELQTLAGPGISELFALPNGRVAQSFSSLLLLLCAQLALLIWWVRSRSLEDFDGRYWLWIRTAFVWLALGGCVSVDAHHAARETLLFLRPGSSLELANLGWMIPVATLGVLLVRALVREMRGCRASRMLLLLAFVCHLSNAGLHLALESTFSDEMQALIVQSGLLTGHVALFVSMWLHARHVVHCTADPAPLARRAWRIPRPHFRLPHLQLSPIRSSQARRNCVEELETRMAPQSDSSSISEMWAAPSTKRRSKTRIRFDSGHPLPSRHDAPESELPARTIADCDDENKAENSSDAMSSQEFVPATPQIPAVQTLAETATCGNGSANPEEATENGLVKPELRGLSKKQRRRLMQEMRERERESRR